MGEQRIRFKDNPTKPFTKQEFFAHVTKANPSLLENPNINQDTLWDAALKEHPEAVELEPGFIKETASNLIPSFARMIGDTAQGGIDIVAAINPLATGQARAEARKKLAPLTTAEGWKMVGQHYADRYGGMENIEQTLRHDPAGALGDVAAVVSIPTGAARTAAKTGTTFGKVAAATAGKVAGSTSRGAKALTTVEKFANKLQKWEKLNDIAKTERVAKGAGVLRNTAGALNTVAEYTNPMVLPTRATRQALSGVRAKAGRGIIREVVNPSSAVTGGNVATGDKVIDTMVNERIPAGRSGLRQVESELATSNARREGIVDRAAAVPGHDVMNIDNILDRLRTLWDDMDAGDKTKNVITERKAAIWNELDKFMKDHLGAELDPSKAPNYSQKANFNPTFDDAVDFTVHHSSTGKTLGTKQANKLRSSMNADLDKAFAAVEKGGIDNPVVSNEARMALRQVLTDELWNVVEKSGVETADTMRAMGSKDHQLMKVRDALNTAILRHEGSSILSSASPYYISAAGAAGYGALTGQLDTYASVVAAIAAARLLYMKAPDIATKFALNLIHKYPDPSIWRQVANDVRVAHNIMKEQDGKGGKKDEPTATPAPPTPPAGLAPTPF